MTTTYCAGCGTRIIETDRAEIRGRLFYHLGCRPSSAGAPRTVPEAFRAMVRGHSVILSLCLLVLVLFSLLVRAQAANERSLKAMAYFRYRGLAVRPYQGTPPFSGGRSLPTRPIRDLGYGLAVKRNLGAVGNTFRNNSFEMRVARRLGG